MAYYTNQELKELGFKYLGENVKISDKASIYDCEHIEIEDNVRIDDFCVVSGKIRIGRYVHVTPMCLLAGGEEGIDIASFCTFAYGVSVFTQSDDYSGLSMVNSNIPQKFKNEYRSKIVINHQTIIGARSVIMPGVVLAEGTSIGAMSLVLKSTEPWSIYIGSPAKRLKARNKNVLDLEKKFLREKKK